MEGQRFDELTRQMAQQTTRRRTLKGLAAGVVAATFTVFGKRSSEASVCRDNGAVCRENANCCSGICGDRNYYGRRTCHCSFQNGEDDGESCNGKCCGSTGQCIRGECVYPSTQSSSAVLTAHAAWEAIMQRDVFAPVVSLIGVKPEVGHRFQIKPGLRSVDQSLIDAEVVELELPHRAVFRWRATGMNDWATAQFTLTESDKGLMFGINRVDGAPETCDLATNLLGRGWQKRAFQVHLPRALGLEAPE